MPSYRDLIDALNRHSDALEADRADRAATRARRIDDARAQLCQARTARNSARKAYRLTKTGNLVGKALIPLGAFLTAGAMLTAGVAVNPMLGLVTLGSGAVLKLFVCSDKRKQQLQERLERAEARYQELEERVRDL